MSFTFWYLAYSHNNKTNITLIKQSCVTVKPTFCVLISSWAFNFSCNLSQLVSLLSLTCFLPLLPVCLMFIVVGWRHSLCDPSLPFFYPPFFPFFLFLSFSFTFHNLNLKGAGRIGSGNWHHLP